MKVDLIPIVTALGCTLTACGNKETTEESNTADTNIDTEDTDNEAIDISAVVGAWNLDLMIETYYGEVYETAFPQFDSYTYENYGFVFVDDNFWIFALDISDEGAADLMVIQTYIDVVTVDGIQIYYSMFGYTYVVDSGSIEVEGDSYSLELEQESLNCTLSEEILRCQNEVTNLEFSYGGEIPDGTALIEEDWPATPDYTKEDCVDAEITTTGNALEWGGFDGVENDIPLTCSYQDYSSVDGYSTAEDHDDLLFSFTAPNDGCFAFNTTGTSFPHGIQVINGCDDHGNPLSCSMTGHAEHEMEAGEEVLVQIDGVSDSELVFNLSINEIQVDTDFDSFPDTGSNIETYYWMEEYDTICGFMGYAKTFLWTAPATGQLTLDTAGSDFDTMIRVEEAICDGAATASCNDNGSENGEYVYTSFLQKDVLEEHNYKITVGGTYWDFGTLSMNLTIQ